MLLVRSEHVRGRSSILLGFESCVFSDLWRVSVKCCEEISWRRTNQRDDLKGYIAEFVVFDYSLTNRSHKARVGASLRPHWTLGPSGEGFKECTKQTILLEQSRKLGQPQTLFSPLEKILRSMHSLSIYDRDNGRNMQQTETTSRRAPAQLFTIAGPGRHPEEGKETVATFESVCWPCLESNAKTYLSWTVFDLREGHADRCNATDNPARGTGSFGRSYGEFSTSRDRVTFGTL
jgi:hypothetical protein